MQKSVINSPIGNLLIVEDKGAIIQIELCELELLAPSSSLLETVSIQIMEYFNQTRTSFDFPTSLPGTDFQKSVWKALQEIQYGSTASYQSIAMSINHPKAYRAVGSACNKNPLLLVVPCHRVVGKNGLGGFAHGSEMKINLLELEKKTTE